MLRVSRECDDHNDNDTLTLSLSYVLVYSSHRQVSSLTHFEFEIITYKYKP